jgi:transcriptional regulator with XRE-family HTH domain
MGYTQEGLAEALHVDRSTVHRWEFGRSEPQPYIRPKLAKLLGVGSRELEALIRGARARPVTGTTPRQPQFTTPASRPASPLNELRHIVIGRAPLTEEPAGPGALSRAISRVHQHYHADVLGQDGNFLCTGFGSANVAIHEISVAVQLGDARQAHALGAALDTDHLPEVLVGRRSQVHLDLSRAATQMQDDGLAVLHLLEAERVAEQAVSRNTNAQEVIRVLLGREQRNSTPGLRALAQRAGING